MSRLTPKEVAKIIRDFLSGSGGAWDWDDFICCKIKDSYLEQIRLRCNKVDEDYPPRHKNEWCNDEGAKVLGKIADEIEKRDKLLGKWRLVKGGDFEQATMFIYDDGKLVYVIPQSDRDQAILLKYQIDGNVLITDQPSHPKEEKTCYEFLENGYLRTETNGEIGIWKRMELTKEDLNWKSHYPKNKIKFKKWFKYLLILIVSYVLIAIFGMAVIGYSIMAGDSLEPYPKWALITLNFLYTICLFPGQLIEKIPHVPSFDDGYASAFVYAMLVTLAFYFLDKRKLSKGAKK